MTVDHAEIFRTVSWGIFALVLAWRVNSMGKAYKLALDAETEAKKLSGNNGGRGGGGGDKGDDFDPGDPFCIDPDFDPGDWWKHPKRGNGSSLKC